MIYARLMTCVWHALHFIYSRTLGIVMQNPQLLLERRISHRILRDNNPFGNQINSAL